MPELVSILSQLSQASCPILLAFKDVVEAVQQPGGVPIDLEPLGRSIVDSDNDFLEDGMDCPVALWRWLTGAISRDDLKFLEVKEVATNTCSGCGESYNTSQESHEIRLGFECLEGTKNVKISELFRKTYDVETIPDFHCKNRECEAWQVRAEGAMRERLDQLSGTRKTCLTQSSPVLFVSLSRGYIRNQRLIRSQRHIRLEPDTSLSVAGIEYELVGVQNHEGGTEQGHWETLVKKANDHETNWWRFSGEDIEKVPQSKVSSKFAVNLVYRRKLSG